jgi:integrase
MLADVGSGKLKPACGETVASYLEAWLATTGALRLSPKSHQSYSGVFRVWVIPELGALPLEKLTARDIEAWLVRASAPGARRDGRAGSLSPGSLRHYVRLLRAALQDAVRQERLLRNPCDTAAKPRVTHEEVTALSVEELRRLVPATSGRLRIAVLLGGMLGLRAGECVALQWADIDFGAGVVTIRRSLEDTKKRGLQFKLPKSGKTRKLALPEALARELRRHKGEQATQRLQLGDGWQNNDLVLAREDGSIWSRGALSTAFRDQALRLGLPTTRFHSLRHSCATALLGCGQGAAVVQAVLGHSTPSFTVQVYGHALPEHMREAARVMDRAMGDALGAVG